MKTIKQLERDIDRENLIPMPCGPNYHEFVQESYHRSKELEYGLKQTREIYKMIETCLNKAPLEEESKILLSELLLRIEGEER